MERVYTDIGIFCGGDLASHSRNAFLSISSHILQFLTCTAKLLSLSILSVATVIVLTSTFLIPSYPINAISSSWNSPLETPQLAATVCSEVPPLCNRPPRKICLMVEPSPFTYVCGYSNRFNEMLLYLSRAGDKVEIITVETKTLDKALPQENFGYPIEHTLGFACPGYSDMSLTVDLPDLKGAKVLSRFRPDLIHCSSPGFILFAAIFYSRVLRIPLLLSYHTHLPLYARNYIGFVPRHEALAWGLLRWAHSRADLTLVTSPQMRDEMVANGIPRVDVWRKGIDTVKFHPKFKDLEMRKTMSNGNVDDFLLVYIGRIGHEKRLKDIKPILQNMGPNTRLCIVGNGPQADELKEFYKDTNTVFTGQLSGDALSKAFASADVFIMPSDSETLGFVVLESMASGVPVIGAAAGGIPDLIHDGEDGFLVPPGDTDAFVSKLRILRDESVRKRMGKAGRAEAERWSWEAATSYLRNVQYEKAVVNFHSRAFGGFGRPGTKTVWMLFRERIRRVLSRLRLPRLRKRNQDVMDQGSDIEYNL